MGEQKKGNKTLSGVVGMQCMKQKLPQIAAESSPPPLPTVWQGESSLEESADDVTSREENRDFVLEGEGVWPVKQRKFR